MSDRSHRKKERRFKAVRRLEDVEIMVENPCDFAWGKMTGDRLVRNCPLCQLNVYNFAGMVPDEILALINRYEGKVCAQFYARSDGTMTVEPCGDGETIRGGLTISSQAEVNSPNL